MRKRRDAVHQERERDGAQRVERLVGQRQVLQQPPEPHPAEQPEDDAQHHLQRELPCPVRDRTPAGAAGAEDRQHQRDTDRVVRPRLTLQQGAGPSGHLATTEDREDDGRVGRGEGGADEEGGAPVEVEERVRQHGQHAGRHEGAGHAEPHDTARDRPEAFQPDVHAAVEQDQDQGNRDDALVGADRQRAEVGEEVGADRRDDQEDRRCGDPYPLADPARADRRQQREGGHDHHQRERDDVVHSGSWGR